MQLTLKNPTVHLSKFFDNDLVVKYLSHTMQGPDEYEIVVEGSNGKTVTLFGEPSDHFVENFYEVYCEHLLGLNRPMPDMVVNFKTNIFDACRHTQVHGSPASYKPDEDKDPIVIITERAYKYFLSKCTESELFDLGFLGVSPDHAGVSKGVIPNLIPCSEAC